MVIKEKWDYTNEQTVQNINESNLPNNFMQFFIVYHKYSVDNHYAPPLMVDFRKRLELEGIQCIMNEADDGRKETELP